MTLPRCSWVPPTDALYCDYHDHEWGVPEYDSRALWEKLVLDGMQAGLSWITVLRKRDSIREAFDGFDPVKVAAYGDADMERLLGNPGIIRSRLKCQAAIHGAKMARTFPPICGTLLAASRFKTLGKPMALCLPKQNYLRPLPRTSKNAASNSAAP